MTDRELMQQALDALEYVIQSVGGNAPESFDVWFQKTQVPAEALRARLAQPEQEPVACPYCHYSHTLGAVFFDQNCAGCVNRMTTPPQRECADSVHDRREWQGLTDEEMFSLWVKCPAETEDRFAFARAIEAQLKGKNT